MLISNVTVGIRNLLLVQAMMIVLVPNNAELICMKLVRTWKTFLAPFLVKRPNRTNATRKTFWEIDMTKFEP